VIQLTPHMRVLVAVEPVDFRQGIDGLVRVCRERLVADPFSGAVYVFHNRRRTSLKLLVFDGQGFWLCQKRLSVGHFNRWPESKEATVRLRAHELGVLLFAGDPMTTQAAPEWRPVMTTTTDPSDVH
jgi:transposase